MAITAFDCVRGTGQAYFMDVCVPVADICGPAHLSRLFLLVLKQFLLVLVLLRILLGLVLARILPGLILAQFAD